MSICRCHKHAITYILEMYASGIVRVCMSPPVQVHVYSQIHVVESYAFFVIERTIVQKLRVEKHDTAYVRAYV
jgi:hypothetical protein